MTVCHQGLELVDSNQTLIRMEICRLGVSDWTVWFLFLFLACTCSFAAYHTYYYYYYSCCCYYYDYYDYYGDYDDYDDYDDYYYTLYYYDDILRECALDCG